MKEQLESVKLSKTTWADFVRETDSTWNMLAKRLMRHRRLPAAVSCDDVKQELLVAAWVHFERWSPDGGQPLNSYVVNGAMLSAKSWLAKQRNAKQSTHGAPSRCHLLYESLQVASDEPTDFFASTLPVQEEQIAKSEAFAHVLRRAKNELARRCVKEFANDGSLDRVAARTGLGRDRVRRIIKSTLARV